MLQVQETLTCNVPGSTKDAKVQGLCRANLNACRIDTNVAAAAVHTAVVCSRRPRLFPRRRLRDRITVLTAVARAEVRL